MQDRGGRSAHAAQIATLETRRAKDYNVPVVRLRDEWRARAAELGLDRERVAAIIGQRGPQTPLDICAVAESLAGPASLTEQLSAFDRRDVIRAWAEAHRGGARVSEVEHHADELLRRADAIRVDTGRGRQQPGGARHSTEGLLRIVIDMRSGQGTSHAKSEPMSWPRIEPGVMGSFHPTEALQIAGLSAFLGGVGREIGRRGDLRAAA